MDRDDGKRDTRMTIDEIRQSDKLMLTPTDVANVLGVTPYSLNIQAKKDITKLGFNASLIGTRLKIPREGFIAWYEGRNTDDKERVRTCAG